MSAFLIGLGVGVLVGLLSPPALSKLRSFIEKL